jgi:hypothetical protein
MINYLKLVFYRRKKYDIELENINLKINSDRLIKV